MKKMILVDSDDKIPKLSELVELVHSSTCPIICQIAHAGTYSLSKKVDVSRIDEEEILRIKDAFISAAVRAEKAGFDGVQLHCAHGFFLSECLSPHSNKRKDGWGGDDEGRFRIVSEIMKGIPPFLVSIYGNGIRSFHREKNGIVWFIDRRY